MYNTITFYTFIALVIFFVGVEIYRSKYFLRGVILEFCASDLIVDSLIATRMKVRLQNGNIIEAEAPRCTMCLGNLSVGDEVSISRSHDRYIVNLPFKITNKSVYREKCFQ